MIQECNLIQIFRAKSIDSIVAFIKQNEANDTIPFSPTTSKSNQLPREAVDI